MLAIELENCGLQYLTLSHRSDSVFFRIFSKRESEILRNNVVEVPDIQPSDAFRKFDLNTDVSRRGVRKGAAVLRLLRWFGFSAYLLVTVCLLLVALELIVRWSFPGINHQDAELSLLLPPGPGGGLVRWRPNASGIVFGESVRIDPFGYRDLHGGTSASGSSWLLVGDSVTFGVGVDAKETFAGQLQAEHPEIKVWNSAVIGYSIGDYLDVVREFLAKPTLPSLVILFFCLNDPAPRFQLASGPVSMPEKVLGLLRRHSKLYMLMKGTLADRSKTYFLNDLAYYDAANPAFRQTVEALGEIHALLTKAGIPLLVVVLPYEYQLRHKDAKDLAPQRLLDAKLHELNIPTLDLYDAFAASGRPSTDHFLYADAMHLSREGHDLVFRAVSTQLEKDNARQLSPAPRAVRR